MKLGFFTSIITDGEPTSGFEIANEAIVAGLRELGHEVHVIGMRLPRQREQVDNYTHVLANYNLENSEASSLKKAEWLARALFKGLPIAAGKLTSARNSQLRDKIKLHGPFDAHIINSYQMGAAFPELLETPFVYVAHNVEYKSARENVESATSALGKYLYRREAKLLNLLESQLCEKARFVWALSKEDLATHDPQGVKSVLLPLVAPQQDNTKQSKKQWDVGLIGTWSWQPNLVGLKWFLNEVCPVLPDDFNIAIAGTTPEGLVSTHPGVSFLGRVESASNFLNSVRVVPLVSQGGTGVQLKTIEAFQAGYCCVATESSLRGIDQLPSNCLQKNAPEDFSNALVSLVEKSVNGSLPIVDGNSFYMEQKAALLRSLALGVQFLA